MLFISLSPSPNSPACSLSVFHAPAAIDARVHHHGWARAYNVNLSAKDIVENLILVNWLEKEDGKDAKYGVQVTNSIQLYTYSLCQSAIFYKLFIFYNTFTMALQRFLSLPPSRTKPKFLHQNATKRNKTFSNNLNSHNYLRFFV